MLDTTGPSLVRDARGLLQYATAYLFEGIAGECNDVERVHHFESLGQFLNGGCYEAEESVHRDYVDAFTRVLV